MSSVGFGALMSPSTTFYGVSVDALLDSSLLILKLALAALRNRCTQSFNHQRLGTSCGAHSRRPVPRHLEDTAQGNHWR